MYTSHRFRCQKLHWIGNCPVEKAKQMKCYKRLIYKQLQFVQVSGLSGPQFLSYLPKRFTHLCRALCGDAILVYRFRVSMLKLMAAGNQQKPLEFTFPIKSSFFSLEN